MTHLFIPCCFAIHAIASCILGVVFYTYSYFLPAVLLGVQAVGFVVLILTRKVIQPFYIYFGWFLMVSAIALPILVIFVDVEFIYLYMPLALVLIHVVRDLLVLHRRVFYVVYSASIGLFFFVHPIDFSIRDIPIVMAIGSIIVMFVIAEFGQLLHRFLFDIDVGQTSLAARFAHQQRVCIEKNARCFKGLSAHLKPHLQKLQCSIEMQLKMKNTDDMNDYFCKDMLKTAKSLNDIINPLLGFSSHKDDSTHVVVSIDSIVTHIQQYIEEEFVNSNTSFQVNYYNIIHSNVYGSEKILNNMFCELINNAVESIQESGCIELNISDTQIIKEDGQEASAILFEIVDNGIGIPFNHLDMIFMPYQSFNKPNHLGLGLVTASQIIYEHKGTINIESNTNGTKVQVCLPTNSQNEAIGLDKFKEEDFFLEDSFFKNQS